MQRDRHNEVAKTRACASSLEATDTFIVANRLPVEYHAVAGWRPSPGGLVSALKPALQGMGVVWVGWRGSPAPEGGYGPKPTRPPQTANLAIVEIPMTSKEVSDFYDGVCNSALWPLYHEAAVEPAFCEQEFAVYRQINQRYADCVVSNAPPEAVVWVHDYHLQLVPAMLRKARPDLRVGFFLHVPFPPLEKFNALPWKDSVLEGLMGADLIGFQTALSAERFVAAVGCGISAANGERGVLLSRQPGEARRVAVEVFPIGPDSGHFADLAATQDTRESASRIRADFGEPELILLGVDRLDYTKGIDVRIRAVADLLKSDEFRGRDIQFIQVAEPSRSGLAAYQQLRIAVEGILHSANAELTELGLRPIHCMYEALPTEQVVALFVAADVMLVTSFADGMNLVSKEFVACRLGGNGRLVLSETTGAAAQLRDAWLVAPGDVEDLKRGIGEAIRAGADEAGQRMSRLRREVIAADAKNWAVSFLEYLRSLR